MNRALLMLAIILFHCAAAFAQDDERFYKNFGMNIGWAVASPQYPGLTAYKSHFDGDAAFAHKPMELGTLSHGFSGGFSVFSGNGFWDFEYRALGLTSKFSYQKAPSEQMKDYSFKLFQHSARFSYNYGRAFGKYGLTGIYLGAGLYAGTWGIKQKSEDKKMDRVNMDDFKGFSMGISPQFTVRLRCIELKAFYDFPFMLTDLAPVYNKTFADAGAANANTDAALKNRLGNFGVSATFFIAFGKPTDHPRPQPARGNSNNSNTSQQSDYQQRRNAENEQSRKNIEETQRSQQREERRSNEKWKR